MSKLLSQSKVAVCCFLLVFVFSGCDQVKKTVVGFFTGEEGSEIVSAIKNVEPEEKKVVKVMTPDTLAKIGSWTITKDEFNERLDAVKEIAPNFDVNNAEAKKLILEELIRQQLFVAEAETTGLVEDKDIVAAVEEFRRTLIVREMAQDIVKDLKVEDSELKSFYDENKEAFVSGYDFRVSEIVVEKKDDATAILKELKNGKDFAALAKEKSISESASKGGDLGFLKEEPFPEMVSALIPLVQGQNSAVFQGPKGYYIIKLTEKIGGEQLEYKDIKEELRQNRLLMKQQETILEYLEKLKLKYTVEKNEGLLGS